MTAGVRRIRLGVEHEFAALVIQGSDIDSVMNMAEVVVAAGKEEEVLAVRQELRPAVAVVLRAVHLCEGCRSAAARRYPIDRPVGFRNEKNDSLLAPTGAAPEAHFAQGNGATAVEGNAFELAVRKEAKGISIRRPEGRIAAFCAGDNCG